ncbi:MAG: DNA anti-recombination protein RmuC [Haloarculaceae archaeon]|jgi:DNA anti-recombination protein RmuC
MGLGGTAKKLQNVVDAAEKLYAKMNEIIGELKELQSDVAKTSEQIDHMEREMAEQRALIEAIADREDIDVEETLDGADLPEPEAEGDEPAGEEAVNEEAVDEEAGGEEAADEEAGENASANES